MIRHAYGHMVHEYHVAQLRDIYRGRREKLAVIRTRKQAQHYCAQVKRQIRRCFGPWPRRTALNAQITGRLDAHGYGIEKVIFESRPNHHVTANLYRPDGNGPFPAVLGALGHALSGKAEPAYQFFAHNLVRQGYIVLLYDPIGQGERCQYAAHHSPFGRWGSVNEHIQAGNQQFLLGQFFGSWRAWDGIRALDYLLSRPEVDPNRVGVTGNSGGGTLTSYLNALDDRFTMAAPSCYVTSFLNNLENELPTDSEQCPPGFLSAGLDMADFFIAQAPRPVLLMGQAEDFFDPRGLEEAYEQVRRIYRMLGAEDSVQMFVGPDNHGYHKANRLAMIRFFNQQIGKKPLQRETLPKVRTPEQLAAATGGQVVRLTNERCIHQFNAERAEQLEQKRTTPSRKQLPTILRRVLQLPRRTETPHYRVLRGVADNPVIRPFSHVWRWAVESEPGIQAMLSLWHSPAASRQKPTCFALPSLREATIYVPHLDAVADMTTGQLPVNRADQVFTIEPRGIGQMRALTCNDPAFNRSYGVEYLYGALGLMLDQSYLGRRVHDILATLDLLEHIGTRRIHLVGRGCGAVLGTYVACLHPLVKQVTLCQPLTSYHALTQSPIFGLPASMMPYAGLKYFDLPDCYSALKSKKLRMFDSWDGYALDI